MALTRQGVPTLDRNALASAEKAKRGAYILREAGGGGPDVILVATGSEVSIALQAAEALEAEGASVRVVSMPCWELFAQEDADYQREVLPKETPKVVVEAGIRQGWDRWVGNDAGFVTVETALLTSHGVISICPDEPTPTRPSTWGRIKVLYR